jgi:Ca2+-binding EF-hand superfamily protein
LDINGNGTLDVHEFAAALRGHMSQARIDVVNQAYDKLDVDGNERVTVDHIARNFRVDKHPDVAVGK